MKDFNLACKPAWVTCQALNANFFPRGRAKDASGGGGSAVEGGQAVPAGLFVILRQGPVRRQVVRLGLQGGEQVAFAVGFPAQTQTDDARLPAPLRGGVRLGQLP